MPNEPTEAPTPVAQRAPMMDPPPVDDEEEGG